MFLMMMKCVCVCVCEGVCDRYLLHSPESSSSHQIKLTTSESAPLPDSAGHDKPVYAHP